MAINQGYFLLCWQSNLQVLLENKPCAIHVADLWALSFLEVDFNAAMMNLVGHCMVCQAFHSNLISSNAMAGSKVYKLAYIPFCTPLQNHLRVELHLGFGLLLCSAKTGEILITTISSH